MELVIAAGTTAGELRKKFSARFPFLRLDFFMFFNGKAVLDAAHRIKDEGKTMAEIRNRQHDGIIVISGNEKVSTLEHTFSEHFGIIAQVSRRSGKIWVLTTSTDDLSLNQQNALGEEMSKDVVADEPEDIHEQS